MSILDRTASLHPAWRKTPEGVRQAFGAARSAAASAPLTEFVPATAGNRAAALGFALSWAVSAGAGGMLFCCAPEHCFAEDGAPDSEGWAQIGLPLERVLLVRTHALVDALWAAEQALTIPGAIVLGVIPSGAKPLSLIFTRRLLLAAEKHKTRCLLLRLDAARATAAWTRWRVAAAPSCGIGREMGPPSFLVRLERNRAGPADLSWRLEWNAHEHAFAEGGAGEPMDGALVSPPVDRSMEAGRRRAG